MAQREEFEITIGPNGQIQVEVKGATGKSCLELTEFLEQALGDVVERKLKPEYYTNKTAETQKIKGQK